MTQQDKSHRADGQRDTALIVHPLLPSRGQVPIRDVEDILDEAVGLAEAISLDVVAALPVKISKISPGQLFSRGALEMLRSRTEAEKPSVVVVNHALSPVQQRNLEKELNAKVIDRTGLILEIFAERAQTREGKIQVRLAWLEYQKSRLVRSWTHLERQRGGTGSTGGPGETQLEIDRRLIGDKIVRLKTQLEDVRRTRALQRKKREKAPYPVAALVGYTNAGKSTLFNTLTGADVFAKNLLFATLDPTVRRVRLRNGVDVMLSDTVGFISDLPHGLVAAFRATLEQVEHAEIILHVVDMSRPDYKAQHDDVVGILRDLGIDYHHDDRVIEIWNKADRLPVEEREALAGRARDGRAVLLSALTGEGVEDLLALLARRFAANRVPGKLQLGYGEGEPLSWLYKYAEIASRSDETDGITLDIVMSPQDWGRFRERFGSIKVNMAQDKENDISY